MPKEDPFVNRAQLLKAIKKYPEIWDSNNKLHMCRSVTAPMWNEIAEQFGGHVPTVKLQSIWSQMKYHYHNLVHRQILHKDRFTTKWEHFEPMSFMYNITVAKIVGASNNATDPSDLPHPLPPSAVAALPQTQGRGRPSGSFTWMPAALPQTEVSVETSPYSGFTGLVPPAAITVETTTTPMRKPGRPGSLNNSMRGRIIDAIKAHPILWAGRQREQRQGQNRTSAVWKEVAVELGLTPSLVQTRWSIIKQRYVDELQKERHARYAQQAAFHSTWEHFERMSFMRDILTKKVDEREQTREHIQEIVSEKQQLLQSHQQHQHLQQQQQQQQMRYMRNAVTSSTTTMPLTSPAVIAHHHQQQQQQQQQQHHQHQQLGMCDESGVLGVSGAHVGVVGLLPGHVGGHVPVGARRRVKAEADLEWDPFEMILHVQAGNEAPATN